MPLLVWLGILGFIYLRLWDAFLTYLRAYRAHNDDLDIALPGDPPSLTPGCPLLSPYAWHILRYVRRQQRDPEAEGKRRAALTWYYTFVIWIFLVPVFACASFSFLAR